MKNLFLPLFLFLLGFAVSAQSVSGIIIDGENDEELIGAAVLVKGSSSGTVSDYDGSFKIEGLENGPATIEISYVGYETKSIDVEINGDTDLGSITLGTDAYGLSEVVVTGVMDIVQDRNTPVAISTISTAQIQAKASGNVELPEVAKATPSVYVANQSGGYGESQVYTRGFDQTNTAFLLNGQPINGMEDGKMYWSNWSGLSEVASAIQIQRGLGASKLAISSVGGTWNFVMKATDSKKGGSVSTSIGNDGYRRAGASYSTGLINNKFAVTALFSGWSGNGWAEGTEGQGQNYFLSAGFKPNENHSINFLVTGAPQWHDVKFNQSIASHRDTNGDLNPRYNSNWGIYNGEYLSERKNYYHKPVVNLSWDWKINDKSKFATVLYGSLGRGGFTGQLAGDKVRTGSGQINFDDSDGYVMRASVNSHNWFGAVLSYENQVTDKITLSVGSDLRTYNGDHFRQVVGLLGADSYSQSARTRYPNGYTVDNSFSIEPWKINNFADEGERVVYDNAETIQYGGIFGQAEYKIDHFSAYIQGAFSSQSHVRHERFNELEANEDSEKVTNTGFNLKGGLSYTFDNTHTFFANSGIYSRQPFHDIIFLNNSNTLNPVTENEEIIGLELGYKLNIQDFSANVNFYRTSWNNRISTSSFNADDVIEIGDFSRTVVNEAYTNSKQDQLHTGVEVDLSYTPTKKLKVYGLASFGSYKINGDVVVDVFDEVTQGGQQELVESITRNGENSIDGNKIGGAPQTSFGGGVKYKLTDNLSSEVTVLSYDNLYSETSNELKLPAYTLVDLNLSYSLPLENGNLIRISGNIYNVFDQLYISRSNTAFLVDETTVDTWNGIDERNSVTFGKTRTWNLSMKYQF